MRLALATALLLLAVAMSTAPRAAAQDAAEHAAGDAPVPFGLAEVRAFEGFEHLDGYWHDGADLLVTTRGRHATLRVRSGATRRLPGVGGAVDGVGVGEAAELVAVARGRVGRLRAGAWRVREVRGIDAAPDGVVLAPDGSALAWNGFRRKLWLLSADDQVRAIPVRPGERPLLAARDPAGGFLVVLRGTTPRMTVARVAGAELAPHPIDASLRDAHVCSHPREALALGGGMLVLRAGSLFCLVDLEAELHLTTSAARLFGNDLRVDGLLRANAGEVLLVASHEAHLWRTADDTLVPLGRLPTRPDAAFVDPRSDLGLLLARSETALSVFPRSGRVPEPAPGATADDGAWLARVDVAEEVVEAEGGGDGRGLQIGLPILRLGFGGAAQLEPDGPGAFAFDLAAGGRLLFRDGDVHPVISAELGYARRGGDQDTHDLTLAVAMGVTGTAFGVSVAESLVFALGERDAFGLRTALRLGTLWHAIDLEIAHGVELSSPRRHELRVQLVLDVGMLIMAGSITGALARALD